LKNGVLEVKNRASGIKEELSLDAILNRFVG